MTDALTIADALFPESYTAENGAYRERHEREGVYRKTRQGSSVRQRQADDLARLASAVGRLSPSHRDPERFHLDRSEIVAELRRLARTLGAAA